MTELQDSRVGGDRPTLVRNLGLLGLAATGICSMMGAAINVVPIMIQRSVPGIGPWVLPAYMFGVAPAILAALSYAILSSAMPRAGGSYIYASRSINPYLGFVASFSQWFGLSVAIGVVAYVLIPFLRDIAAALRFDEIALLLDQGPWRVGLALAFLWIFTAINVFGATLYEGTLVPLMFLMFAGGTVVVVAGFSFDHADFAAAVAVREGVDIAALVGRVPEPFSITTFLAASVVLFSSFIGFDSIAQAGGEAKNANRNLPLAIGIAVVGVGSFYMLFTAAVYHAVPWQFVAERAASQDLTAPGLLGYLLTPGWTVVIVAGAAIALINDLPAMVLAVSRLMFAWAEDGIFPPVVMKVNRRWRSPHVAIIASGLMASCGVLGSHLAGDFFLGVDILVTSMLVNFLLMCVSVLWLPRRNPALATEVTFIADRRVQRVIALAGGAWLLGYLVVHIATDLRSQVAAWYFHSTWLWLLVMGLATLIFLVQWGKLGRNPEERRAIFERLPAQ